MLDQQKLAILHYVNSRDPTGAAVKLNPSPDFQGGTVAFGADITQHRVETQLKAEKWVEAYLIAKLVCELGYPAASIELQKEYPAGHPQPSTPRIDVLVRDDRHPAARTFMMIEAKAPEEFERQKQGIEGQLFALGDHERARSLQYMVYYTCELVDHKLLDKALIIDATRFADFDSWDNQGRPSLDQLPIAYATAIKSTYANKPADQLQPGEKALDRRLTRNDFMALRTDLHNVLWGGGGTPDNDVFSILVKLFLAKIYDEELTPVGHHYGFQITFKDGEPQPASEVVTKLNSRAKLSDGRYEGLFRRAQRDYLEMSDEDISASQGLDTEKVSPGKIAYVVEQLQGISLTQNESTANSDILGEFFEGIVRAGFKQSKGQFFTHPKIVNFCIYALKLDELAEDKISKENALPFIVDPACGSGTFLIQAMKAVTAMVRSRGLGNTLHKRAQQLIASWFPPLKQNVWAREFIYGLEINSDLALATKVNMVLHGDGNINVLIRDGLLRFDRYHISQKVSALAHSETKPGFPYRYPVNERFDVLLSNPPFSVNLDNETKRGLNTRFEFAAKGNSENLFIERWYQLLKPRGRMAVVLPEGVFDTGENDYIRLFLFKYFHVKAIVSLPELVFKPWTPTRTSLLFAVKKRDEEVRAYEEAWRDRDKDFRKLLKDPILAHIVRGQRILDAVMRLGSRYNVAVPLSESPIETVRSLAGVLNQFAGGEFEARLGERVERYRKEVEAWSSVDPDAEWPPDEAIPRLRRFLKAFFDERYEGKSTAQVLDRHWEEVLGVAESSYWTFAEVASVFDEPILYYEAQNVGYKRTTNREREAPNDLFALTDGRIDLSRSDTILGQIRLEVNY